MSGSPYDRYPPLSCEPDPYHLNGDPFYRNATIAIVLLSLAAFATQWWWLWLLTAAIVVFAAVDWIEDRASKKRIREHEKMLLPWPEETPE